PPSLTQGKYRGGGDGVNGVALDISTAANILRDDGRSCFILHFTALELLAESVRRAWIKNGRGKVTFRSRPKFGVLLL
ncbi:MAG: hypothetical protein FWC43_01350, partial [Planctomycetaceae bacterium]|nr:hypothetical protein [Planctomycetaceae bacterium]